MNKSLLIATLLSGLLFYSCSSTATDSTTKYEIALTASPAEGGSVSPAIGEYEESGTLEISATPNEGWEFVEWTGDYTGSNATIEITVDANKDITAIFEKKSYELTVTTSGEGTVEEKVVTSKATDYEHGTIVELTANPATGWKFVEWQGAITGAQNPQELIVDDPKDVTAVFEKKNYPLTINKTGEGVVNETIVQNKLTDYDYGTTVELTATPATGWEFVEWQDDLTGSTNPQQITVDNPKDVTAIFEKKTFPLTTSTTGQGSITKNPDQQEYEYGTMVDLSASAANGWQFVEWQGDVTGTDNPVQLIVDDPKDVTAIFEKKNYPLTVNTTGQGTVSEELISQKKTDYEYDSMVKLTATPSTGWEFVEWQDDLTGSTNPQQITVDSPKEVTAIFEKKTFSLNLNTTGQGIIAKNPDQLEYEYGTSVNLSASAANGWEFVEWQGDVNSTDNTVQLTIEEEKDITAVFKKKSFVLDIDITGQGTVAKSPDQATYEYGTIVELTANAENGWEFSEWEGDVTSISNFIELTINSPRELTAVFTEEITPLFYLAENGVTIKCEDASVGDTGTVNGITYTKRSASQISSSNAETSCTSGITNMYQMFNYNSSFNGDISSWDVSNVESMEDMFNNADSFNGDLGSWDVSSVTDMEAMFFNADSFNNPEINNWDVSNVTNMEAMFSSVSSFNQDLIDWDVSSVTTMNRMFDSAYDFNGKIGSWDVSSVEDMEDMFEGAESFNQSLNNWNVSNVTTMSYMFYEATNFNQNLSNWNVSSVTNMQEMFYEATSFNGNIGTWDVSSVTTMEYMFGRATSFNQNLNNWNVSSVLNMEDMFYRAINFNGDISDWDVGDVTSMEGMFQLAENFNIDISNWDVGDVREMDYMFDQATIFNQDLSGWCVIRINSIPYSFSTESALSSDHRPIWGTCR